MRKCWMLLMALMCLGAACAEVYGDDLYYHAIPDCMGNDHAPLEDIGGRWPCPVCVDEADDNSLRCYSLGGLTVVRMTDGFMASRQETVKYFALPGADAFTGGEAEAKLAELMHGGKYRDFKAAMREDNRVTAQAAFAASTDELSVRHLGGAWLEVLPPVDAVEASFYLCDLEWKDGALSVKNRGEWWHDRDPEVGDLSDIEACRDAAGAGWRAALYEAEGLHVLTLRITGEDALAEPTVTLSCPGWPDALTMETTWRDGDACVYGVALTEAEAAMLKAGELSVRYRGFRELAVDYGESDYGMGRTEKGLFFVLDRAGSIVLPPEYVRIQRAGNVFLCERDMSVDGSVYDADHHRVLMEAEGMTLGFRPAAGGFTVPEYDPVKLFRAGERNPAAVLAGHRGYTGTTALTLYGDPDIYLMRCHPAVARWFDDGMDRPEAPEGALVGCVSVDVGDGKRNCAVIVWSLNGGEKPSPEALGLIDHENLGDYYLTQLKWMYIRLKQLTGANQRALLDWFPKLDEVVKQWIFR